METEDLLDLINKTVSPIKTEKDKNEVTPSSDLSNITIETNSVTHEELTAVNNQTHRETIQQSENNFTSIKVEPESVNCFTHGNQTGNNSEQSLNVCAHSQLEQQNSDSQILIKEEPPDNTGFGNVETASETGCSNENPADSKQSYSVDTQSNQEQHSDISAFIKAEPHDQSYFQTTDIICCTSCGNEINQSNLNNELRNTQNELEATKKLLTRAERQLEKADNYNNVLRNMVENLSSELHRYKNAKTQSTSIQVDQEDFLNYITGDYSMPTWNVENQTTAQRPEVQGPSGVTDPLEQEEEILEEVAELYKDGKKRKDGPSTEEEKLGGARGENLFTIKRFKSLTDEELAEIADHRFTKKTKKNSKWGFNVFNDWCKEKNLDVDLRTISEEKLCHTLSLFYAEAQPKPMKGRETQDVYHKNSMKNMRGALNRYLQVDCQRTINIVTDKAFKKANDMLIAKLKSDFRQGLSRPTQHTSVISQKEMCQIFSSLEKDGPVELRYKMWMLLSLQYCRQRLEFITQLSPKSFKLAVDETGRQFVTLTHVPQPKYHHSDIDSGVEYSDKCMYQTGGPVCPVFTLIKYLSKINPEATSLFSHINKEALANPHLCRPWYQTKPVGQRQFSNFMPEICKLAGLSKRYTAQCLQATAFRAISNENISSCSDQLTEMSVTVTRTSTGHKRETSNILCCYMSKVLSEGYKPNSSLCSSTTPTSTVTSQTTPPQLELSQPEPMTIADSVKAAAEAVVQQQTNEALLHSGYVYDDQSGLYYHTETGYYYNTEKGLYYDPTSYTYFYYNYETGEYQFHSKVDPSEYYMYNTATQGVSPGQATQKQQTDSAKKKKEKKKKKAKFEEEKIFKNRKERRKAMLERKQQKKKKKAEKKKKHSDRKKKKKKEINSDDESEWDSEEERVVHRSERKHKRKRKHRKKSKSKSDKHRKSSTELTSDRSIKKESEVSVVKSKQNESDGKVIEIPLQVVENEQPEKVGMETNDTDCMETETNQDVSLTIKKKDEIHRSAHNTKGNDSRQISDLADTNISNSQDITVAKGADTKYDKVEDVCTTVIKTELSDVDIKAKDDLMHVSDVVSVSSESLQGESTVISDVDMESGELSDSTSSDSSEDSSDTYSDISSSEDNMHDDITEQQHQDIASQWPPCIRGIVTKSNCVDVGMLYLITCSGVTIGRVGDRKHDIPLNDINISKWHAEILYNTDQRQYEIADKGSQNGTFVNDQRLSVSKEASTPHPLVHGDIIQVADTKILCHIHTGTDTCDDCEPGVVMAKHKATQPLPEVKILSAEEKKRLQKDQVKQLMKKFGLKNADYEVHKSLRNTDYSNRAEERRQTVGSDTPGVKQVSAPASVHRPISSENVGHKLLQKMGWKEGDSLGKSNSGIQEPISVQLRANQAAGLGSQTAGMFSADDANSVDIRKASRRAQAQQRYIKLENSNKPGPSQDKIKGLTWCKGDTEFT